MALFLLFHRRAGEVKTRTSSLAGNKRNLQQVIDAGLGKLLPVNRFTGRLRTVNVNEGDELTI